MGRGGGTLILCYASFCVMNVYDQARPLSRSLKVQFLTIIKIAFEN